jgi:hypothetical protein
MASLLTHIASRLSGSERTLRPRTPSLFEPVATAAFNLAVTGTLAEEQPRASAFERADEVDAQAVAKSPPVAGRVSSSKDRRTGTLVVTPNSAALDGCADPQPEAVGDHPAARANSRGPGGQAQPTSMIERVADRDAEATRDAPASKNASTAIRPAGIVARTQRMRADQVAGVDTIERIDARTVVVRRGTAQTSFRLSDATRTAADDRRDITAAIIIQPASGMNGILQAPVVARMAPEPLLSTRRAQKSEPVIHVTIGRVEVRAVAASTSDSTRPERPSPVMSLDEYLRTRTR